MNIVLASGFLVPQNLGPIEYFRGVKAHLEAQGHRVATPPVPVVKSCRERAQKLADGIEAKFQTQAVHIIAHSMGGLDCRMMIGENMNGFGEKGRVLSLTTLSTPHQGSPLADLLAGNGPEDLRRLLIERLKDAKIDVEGLKDLTSDVDGDLPDVAKKIPHIRSYAASGRGGVRPTTYLLLPGHAYIKQKTGRDNDGAVDVGSAVFGEFKGAWPCDHFQIVGHNFDPPSLLGRIAGLLGLGSGEFDHLAKFDAIVAELQADDLKRAA